MMSWHLISVPAWVWKHKNARDYKKEGVGQQSYHYWPEIPAETRQWARALFYWRNQSLVCHFSPIFTTYIPKDITEHLHRDWCFMVCFWVCLLYILMADRCPKHSVSLTYYYTSEVENQSNNSVLTTQSCHKNLSQISCSLQLETMRWKGSKVGYFWTTDPSGNCAKAVYSCLSQC